MNTLPSTDHETLALLRDAQQALAHAIPVLQDDPSFATSIALKGAEERGRHFLAKAEAGRASVPEQRTHAASDDVRSALRGLLDWGRDHLSPLHDPEAHTLLGAAHNALAKEADVHSGSLTALKMIEAQAQLTAKTFPNAPGRGDWLRVQSIAREAIAKYEEPRSAHPEPSDTDALPSESPSSSAKVR